MYSPRGKLVMTFKGPGEENETDDIVSDEDSFANSQDGPRYESWVWNVVPMERWGTKDEIPKRLKYRCLPDSSMSCKW